MGYGQRHFLGVHPTLILLGCLLLGAGKRVKSASKTLREFSHNDIGFVLLDGGKVATFMGALVTAPSTLHYRD